MRLRNHTAALALGCATAAAAFGQGAAPPPPTPQTPDSREVRVTERRSDPNQSNHPGQPPQSNEEQRVVELYRAQLGGQLTKAAYLGVSTSAVPAALRQHLGLPEGVGLVVDHVQDDSPAKAAGLKQYDILTKFDDQILVNGQQLAVLVRSRKGGEEVKLTLLRGGKEQTLTARLVEQDVKPLEDMFIFDHGDAFGTGQGWQGRATTRLARPVRPQPPHNQKQSGNRTLSVWRDNDLTITIRKDDQTEGRRVSVADKSGKTIFEGNLDKQEDRAKMPPHVAEKVKQMERAQLPGGDRGREGGDLRGSFDFGAGKGGVDVRLEGSVEFSGESDARHDARHEAREEVEHKADGDRKDGPSARRAIRDNDLLNIAITDVHGPGVRTEKVARVRDGQVRLPYVAPVKCVGLTEHELERQIVSLYARAKVAPNVNVTVRAVRPAAARAPKPNEPAKP